MSFLDSLLDALPGLRVAGRQIASLFAEKERAWTCPACYSYNRWPTTSETRAGKLREWSRDFRLWCQCYLCGVVPPPGTDAPPAPPGFVGSPPPSGYRGDPWRVPEPPAVK